MHFNHVQRPGTSGALGVRKGIRGRRGPKRDRRPQGEFSPTGFVQYIKFYKKSIIFNKSIVIKLLRLQAANTHIYYSLFPSQIPPLLQDFLILKAFKPHLSGKKIKFLSGMWEYRFFRRIFQWVSHFKQYSQVTKEYFHLQHHLLDDVLNSHDTLPMKNQLNIFVLFFPLNFFFS